MKLKIVDEHQLISHAELKDLAPNDVGNVILVLSAKKENSALIYHRQDVVDGQMCLVFTFQHTVSSARSIGPIHTSTIYVVSESEAEVELMARWTLRACHYDGFRHYCVFVNDRELDMSRTLAFWPNAGSAN